MFETAINILKNIEYNGFEAFIIGGYPRDLYLNKYSDDIDICTNAKYGDLKNIYPDIKSKNYGSYILKVKHQEEYLCLFLLILEKMQVVKVQLLKPFLLYKK